MGGANTYLTFRSFAWRVGPECAGDVGRALDPVALACFTYVERKAHVSGSTTRVVATEFDNGFRFEVSAESLVVKVIFRKFGKNRR